MTIFFDKNISRRHFHFKFGILIKKRVLYIFGFSFGYFLDPLKFNEKEEFNFRIYLPSLLKDGASANYIGI